MIKTELEAYEREAYEQFFNAIISTPHDEKELANALKKFVPGSDTHDFLYLIMQMNLNDGKLNESNQKKLLEYIANCRKGFSELSIRNELLQIENAEPQKKQELLQNLVEKTLNHNRKQTYSKPRFGQNQQVSKQEGQIGDSVKNATLDNKIFDIDLLEIFYKNIKSISQNQQEQSIIKQQIQFISMLPQHTFHTLDFGILSCEAVLQVSERGLIQNFAGVTNQSLMDQIKTAITIRQLDNNKTISENLLKMMSQDQLSNLDETMPDSQVLIAIKFQKKYCEALSYQQIWTFQEKYDNLLKLYLKIKNEPILLQMELLMQLLKLGVKVNIYNKEQFTSVISFLQKTDKDKNQFNWLDYIPNIVPQADWRETKMQYYHYFAILSRGDLSEFNEFANPNEKIELRQIEDKIRISLSTTGLEGLNLNTKIDASEFKRISDIVSLKFLPETKEKFKIDDLVELCVEVKNVTTLHCKIFEFNTLTYYRKTMKPFETSIDLDGLESSIEKTFEFNQQPNCTHYEKFQFPELTGRVGLFIIEFVGNGKSSRAVIKKGSLSLIHKSTIAGHQTTILDDNREICKGTSTGLWLDNKFYAAKEDGTIFIPYSSQVTETKVIMVHEGFAQLSEFTRKSEIYNLETNFFINSESVIVGANASILVTPLLTINGRRANLSLLKNISISVSTADFIDNIPTTNKFTNLKVSEGNDLQVSIQVPSNLKYIEVIFSCQVLNTTDKVTKDFSKSHRFQIVTFESSTQVHELHLKMVQDNKYEIWCLGKNGEPQKHLPLQLQFQHFAHSSNLQANLDTDEEGKLYLGCLKNVKQISVQGRVWTLPNLNQDEWIIPSSFDCVVGGKIEIPVCLWTEQPDRQQFTFIRSQNNLVLEDCFSQIKICKDNHYSLLIVQNLKVGDYILEIRQKYSQTITINITVHDGQFLKNIDQVILKQNCLQEIATSQKIVKVQSTKRIDNNLSIKLSDFSKNVRVHLVANHFMPENFKKLLEKIASLISHQVQSSIFTFAQWTNLFLSDRKLSDEYRYVFDRTKLEHSLGNSLDRPSLLNKRIFTRKTEIDQEVLNSGGQYNQIPEQYAKQSQQVMRGREGEMQYASQSQQVMRGREGEMKGRKLLGGHYQQQEIHKEDYITDYQNFLKDAPNLILNLQPDENGQIIIKDIFGLYSTLQIIVVDDYSACQHTINLQQQQKPAKRDLTLKKSLDQSKGMTESRIKKVLLKNETDFIEDITSSSIMIVDDLAKVTQILNEISAKDSYYKKLDFVSKWHSYNKDQKNFYYSEYSCHEINYYIKLHDENYFESVVRPFLQTKLRKSFVDLFLLDLDSEILLFGTSFKYQQLNIFELCLLIEVLVRNKQSQQAKRIAKSLRDKLDTNENVERTNQLFDLVLNMNSTNKNTNVLPQSQTSSTFGQNASQNVWQQQNSQFGQQYDLMDIQNFGGFGNAGLQNQRANNFRNEKFEQLEKTAEYMETNYYNPKKNTQKQDLFDPNRITTNKFWCDYADYLISQGTSFISPNFTDCASQPIQIFLCKVLLDFPQNTNASSHKFEADQSRGLKIQVGSNAIIYKKEIKEVEVQIQQDFMVTHRYQRIDAYGKQNQNDDDEATPNEFLVNIPYECQVILTNVSPQKTSFNLLYQVPIGSMPIQKTKFMKSQPLSLDSYSTQKLSFQFYFPYTGKFGHYPSNVSIGDKVTARGQSNTLNVVQTREISQQNALELNFDDLVQVGTNEQILDYLRSKNIWANEKGFDVNKIVYLLQDKNFWSQAIQIYREREVYHATIWNFGLTHLDEQTIHEYLMKNQCFGQISGYFKSALFEKTPILSNSNFFRMLEYNPMINSRAHAVGDTQSKKILNKTFRQTYDSFLQTVFYKKQLSFEDKLIYIYYLQLQDRIPEAIELFCKIEPAKDQGPLEIQYDYLCAYFDFFTGSEDGYKLARRIVQRYDNYPVSYWKTMFLAIEDQLNDFDGEFDSMNQTDYSSESESSLRQQKHESLKESKDKEPSISNSQIDEKGALKIESVNIKEIEIKYYMIDAEILFSRTPFLKKNTEEFAFVKPCFKIQKTITAEQGEYTTSTIEIPQQFVTKNLVIEINAVGKQIFKTFYSCSLKVQILEQFGELKVLYNDQGIGKIYVKVFMKDTSGNDSFYMDGYTDIRGKFEYASTSNDKLKQVEKFAILIQSEEHGSMIKEIEPPKSISNQNKSNGQAELVQMKQERIMTRCNYVQQKRS